MTGLIGRYHGSLNHESPAVVDRETYQRMQWKAKAEVEALTDKLLAVKAQLKSARAKLAEIRHRAKAEHIRL